MEVETHLLITVRPGLSTDEKIRDIWQTAKDTGEMLNRLIRALQEPK
jgi:hypothetical protein